MKIQNNCAPVEIPKVLHYCWFGHGPLTEQATRSLATWEKYAPGFSVQRWDESNFDVSSCAWTRGAYDAGKWAFVSDYVRFKVLFDHGGIYMDVGSELVRDISPLVDRVPFSAIEAETRTVNTGLVAACEQGNPIVGEVLDDYGRLTFSADPSFLLEHTVNAMLTTVFERYGYVREDRLQSVSGWTLLPSECFDPKLDRGGYVLTENTFSIHHSSASWVPDYERFRVAFIKKWAPVVGDFAARKTARLLMAIRYRRWR